MVVALEVVAKEVLGQEIDLAVEVAVVALVAKAVVEVVEVLEAAVAIKEKEEMIVEAATEIEAEEEMIAPVTLELAEAEAANAQVILVMLAISLNLAANVVENLSQIQVVQVVEEEEELELVAQAISGEIKNVRPRVINDEKA